MNVAVVVVVRTSNRYYFAFAMFTEPLLNQIVNVLCVIANDVRNNKGI